MRVTAMKPILYDGKVYGKGEAFDIDEVNYYARLKRGEIEKVTILEEEVVNVNEGLPALDEVTPQRKKKNANA